MVELSEKELKIGKKQLEGVLIFCWVMAILLGLAVFSGFTWGPFGMMQDFINGPFNFGEAREFAGEIASYPFKMVYSLIAPALFIAELIGIYQRKAFAVPLGRTVLVLSMVFMFPVGTIIGGILWKRFNHPLSKKYLNYEDEHTMAEEEIKEAGGKPENSTAAIEVTEKKAEKMEQAEEKFEKETEKKIEE